MDALLIFTTTLSIGTLVLCFYTDLSREVETVKTKNAESAE